MIGRIALTLGAALLASSALAQTVTTPEGARMEASADLHYPAGSLTEAQLRSPAREVFAMEAMNVFRRFPREVTQDMVRFYVEGLGLRSLSPIQLTSSQQMLLTGVGRAQIKLSAGQQGDRSYDLSGGPTGGTGIRFFALTFPDEAALRARFAASGFTLPALRDMGDGTRGAFVDDPGGFPIKVVIRPGAQDGSNDGVGVGIGVSNLATSRAFYREFVGLDELPPVNDPLLGRMVYPYRNGETTLYLYDVGTGHPADTGNAGIQYVVSDSPLVAAKGEYRHIEVLTPLNRLTGFNLITVWLADPDGVTNYFAQLGQGGRSARADAEPAANAPAAPATAAFDPTVLPPVPLDYQPGRTAWGDPDLRGVWPIDHLNGLPLQRTPEQGNRHFLTDEEYGARQQRIDQLAARYENEESNDSIGQGHWVEMGEGSRRTSLLVLPQNGRLPPMTEEGQRLSALMRSSWRTGQTYDSWTDFDNWDRCITRGLPASMMPMMYNNGLRVFQAPGLVAIQMEMIHETRVIYTDGRPPISSQIGNWLGDSRGHWENGNTLVVETTNFRPGASATNIVTSGSPPANDTPMSTQARLVERFTMTGPDSIVYETVYTDPVIFTAPWGTRLDWQRNQDYEFFEYACHEGNVQVRNYINASRAARAGAAPGATAPQP